MKKNIFVSEWERLLSIDDRNEQIDETLKLFDKAMQGDTLSMCIIACFVDELDPRDAASIFDE